MENSELIHAFIDGSLDPLEENKFTMMFSSNEEFRNEFRKSMAVERAMVDDAVTLTPSAVATVGVFSKLGFVTPGTAAAVTNAGLLARISTFFSGNAKPFLSALSGALATAAIFWLFLMPENNMNISNESMVSQGNIPVTSSYAINDNSNQFDGYRYFTSYGRNSRIINNYIPVYVDKPNESSNFIADENINDINRNFERISQSTLIPANPGIYHLRANTTLYSNSPKSQNFNLNTNNNEKIGLNFVVAGNQFKFYPEPPYESPSRPRFSNMSIGVLLPVSDKLEIGGEVRQEHFYQEYDGMVGNYEVIYQQYPSFITYSGIAKFRFASAGMFDFVSQGSLGGNRNGIVGRAMIGVEYVPSPDFNFILGIEGGMMNYWDAGNAYQSYKIGLNYGIGLNL